MRQRMSRNVIIAFAVVIALAGVVTMPVPAQAKRVAFADLEGQTVTLGRDCR